MSNLLLSRQPKWKGRGGGGGDLAASNAHFNSQTNTPQPDQASQRYRGRVLNIYVVKWVLMELNREICVCCALFTGPG